jgi:SpoVK/Ycf46/Vps4 family AAA+-type ATPase
MRKKAFTLKRVVDIENLKEGDFIGESDLALQHQGKLWQFKYTTSRRNKKYVIKPGIWQLSNHSGEVSLSEIELVNKRILPDLVNTKAILDEARNFFSKLDVYKELDIQPKRGVLLYSAPGYGKTATISMFCRQAVEEDSGTVVVIWPTSKISSDEVQDFLATESKYAPSATRLIFVLEDIGGGNSESEGARSVESGLLNLLDGMGEAFKLPTFIIATTNTPERLLESLSDRPGRFDLMLQLNPPTPEERLRLFEFVAKRSATDEEKAAILDKSANNLSAAHITEIVVRHRLKEEPVSKIVSDIVKHNAKVKNNFSRPNKVGFED